jgi:hypothetical protein
MRWGIVVTLVRDLVKGNAPAIQNAEVGRQKSMRSLHFCILPSNF